MEQLFITCPKCNKVAKILRVTAGITLLHNVIGIMNNNGQRGARLSGYIRTGGEFAGYQCAKCRAIIATDPDTLVDLIDKHGKMLMSD